jgi:hypothetical protein
MLMLAESIHEAALAEVLVQGAGPDTDWPCDPAWEHGFSVLTARYAASARRRLFWWGGALAHLRRQQGQADGDTAPEDAAAQAGAAR